MRRQIALLLLFFSIEAHASPFGSQGNWWLTVGTGLGVGNDVSGAANYVSLNYQIENNRLLTIRAANVLDSSSILSGFPLCSFSAVASSSSLCGKHTYSSDIGLVYSFLHRAEFYYLSAGAGFAWVRHRTSGANTKKHRTIGLPVEAQVFRMLTPYIGAGTVVFGDLNPKKSFYAATIALQFGMLD